MISSGQLRFLVAHSSLAAGNKHYMLRRRWEAPCAPCILTGAIDSWPATKLVCLCHVPPHGFALNRRQPCHLQWSLESLVTICGDVEFTFSSSFWSAGVKTKYTGAQPKSRVKMTMKQYVNYMVQQASH